MAKYVIDDSTLTSIADSIRRKTGSIDDIKTNEMATTLDLIPDRADDDVVVSSGNVTVFAGNYVADVYKTVDSVPLDTPTIEVTPDGVIKATVSQPDGYVFEDTQESTEQLPVAESNRITPSTEEQVAISSGTYATGDIVVEGDSNLLPENIVQGVSIFGVEGSYDPKELPESAAVSVSIFNTYHDTDIINVVFIEPDGTQESYYHSSGLPVDYSCTPNSILVLYVRVSGAGICALCDGENYLLYEELCTGSYPVHMFVFRITESCSIEIEEGPEMDSSGH